MVRRREFTYQEKKFNRLGRQGLIDYFKTKYDPTKIQMWALTDLGQNITRIEAKAIAQKLEEETFEKQKEFIIALVDGILMISKMFELENVEAFALWCHVMKAQGELKKELGREPTEEEVGKVMDRAVMEAYEFYERNPNRFLDILKLFT